LSQPDAAHERFVEAATTLQDLVALEPQNAEYQIELARIEILLGVWHFDQRDHDQAGEVFHAARRRLTELLTSDQASSLARDIDALLEYIDATLADLVRPKTIGLFPEDP
jgi:hypothetical protein